MNKARGNNMNNLESHKLSIEEMRRITRNGMNGATRILNCSRKLFTAYLKLHREKIKKAQLVAVPGCMAAAGILALAPIVKSGKVEKNRIVADFKVGPQELVRSLRCLLIILSIVVTATTILTFYGKLGGDATGFIFGTILGSAFTFLQRYLSKSEEAD
jgi:hypothetical protein